MIGSLRRWTMVTFALFLVPSVLAATPAPNLPTSFSLGGQDLTDLAMDPSGEFVVAVVPVDPASLVTLPGAVRHNDIYPCHFGPPASTSTGSGCRNPGFDHGNTRRATQLGANQVVDYSSFTTSAGLVARYAVGGPSDTLGLWSSIEDVPRWEVTVAGNQGVIQVAIAPDAGRILAGTAPVSGQGPGRMVMYNASTSPGGLLWAWDFSDSRPTSMDYARAGTVAVVGTAGTTATTTGEVLVFRPTDRKPVAGTDLSRFATGGDVTHVLLSRSGTALVVGTTQGVYYVPVDAAAAKPAEVRSFTSLTGGVQRVALSLDGERFAAASGNKIHFFRHLNNTLISEKVGSEFDAGQAVTDLAYDATGQLLVAIAGNRVYGFGPAKSTPIWSFDATETANGALDGPLRKISISDGAERIVVGGKTRIMPYRTLITAAASFVQAQRMEVQPSTSIKLQLAVTNKGSVPDNYTFSARFPPGWNGYSPDHVALDPEETAVVNFTVDVPTAQAPGFYGVEVDVRSKDLQDAGRSNVIVAKPTLNLTVPRSVVLNVTTSEERIPSLRQGGEITVPVTIRNRGNADGVVNLSTTQILSRGAPWVIRFQSEQVNLPAGGELTVNLVVNAPVDAASGDKNTITICAREGQPKACVGDVTLHTEATRVIVAYVDPKFGAELSTNASTFEFGPGELRVVTVTILNSGNTDDSYNLTTTISPGGVQNDWRVTMERDFIKIPRGEKRSVSVTVRAAVTDPREASLIVRAISIGSTHTEDSALTISLIPRPLVTTPEKSLIPLPPAALALGLVALVALSRRRGGA